MEWVAFRPAQFIFESVHRGEIYVGRKGLSMRKKDIKFGHSYADGKGNVRKVIDEGAHCLLYEGVENKDGVRYRVTRKGRRSPKNTGYESNSTRASLAAWARYKCDEQGRDVE